MITFKNIAGNKSLAVGTIKRKSALNGEKSLTGNLYDGKDVLNKIDKGWSLEFDGEPYVVTYFERNDNDNSVSFDAIHKFFWDMTKKVLYSSTEISGSHTIKWYLDQIFANTGYTYALNFSPAAIEKDNWGNKTRLSLFNDLITSIAGEFEINGTLISIFQNIGTDLSTIVRYGFNLSDMTLENDATSFVTYGEGFGAYANQENQTGDRVHVTYTSPLAGVYGILQAEPIDDQRYTSQANLQAAVKSQVDASFSVSVQLSLYDLTAAGYPYKMANVGDWLTAVDENLDFKQRIRIISIDDEFSADGTRISYTVTAGDVGLTKKYQDANASMSSQIANAVASASQAATDANNALISANGKNTSYYLNSVDDLPTKANEGDLAWVKSGDGTVMYIYTKKAVGSYYWEKRIDPEMGDQIEAGVTEAVAQANAHTDEVKQGLSTDIDTAKSQAASQASTAEANAKSAATSQFNQAKSDLAQAKTDITNAYKTADGVVNKKIDDTASSITTTINQNKQDADGKISTAQTTATTALNGLSSKVSQTDYDTKTGQLTTSVSKAQQTADTATTSLANYKTDADGRISANSADIITNANVIKQKVAQSDYDANNTKLTSRLTTVETTANGTATTVSNLQQTVNNLGQVNQLFNTEFSPDGQGWIVGSGWGPSLNVPIWNSSYVYSISSSTGTSYLEQSLPVPAGTTFSLSANLKTYMSSTDTGTVNLFAIVYDSAGNTLSTLYYLTINQTLAFSNYKKENLVTPTGTSTIRFGIVKRGTISAYINQPMLVFAPTVGTYVQGNYNNNAALAQVKITAEGINNFVRDSSGNISSNFQTALSKTSIITGSTLATSIQQQTSSQITSALTDNNGKIISLINQDTSGVQIAGKNIVLNGDTTVTGAFKVSQANIANGAIGTAQIGDAAITSAKIATIDAGKITTGTLTGVNVTVDKNLTMGTSGVMTWALSGSWRDYSFDPYYVYYRQDGNPNQYYVNTVQTGSLNISASNTGGSLTFNGSITAPNAASDTKSYYMYYPSDISTGTNTLYTRVNMGIGGVNVSSWGDPSNRGKNLGGYTSIGPTGLVATQNLNNLNSYVSVDGELGGGRLDLFYDFSKFSLAGNSASFRYTTANNLQIAAPAGIDIGGGTLTKIGSDTTASILLRSDSGGNAVVSTDVYARTYSYASNMYVTSAGTIGRATSASKYKLAITHYDELDRANKLLSIKPARWFDKAETEQYADELNGGDGYGEHLPVKPHFGLIAEDLVEAGLEEFVSYGADGQVEGLEYERVWTTLIPLIKNMKERIEELERKVA